MISRPLSHYMPISWLISDQERDGAQDITDIGGVADLRVAVQGPERKMRHLAHWVSVAKRGHCHGMEPAAGLSGRGRCGL